MVEEWYLMFLTCSMYHHYPLFFITDEPPQVNLLSSLPDVQYGSYGNYVGSHGDIQGYQYLPLGAVLKSSITSALEAQ